MQRLFQPATAEELLKGWLIHANKGRQKHEEAARRLESSYRRVGVLSIILSAVVGASVFASLEALYEPWSRVVAGIVSISASVLASLMTFHRYEEQTDKHRAAGVRYKAAVRQLEEILSSPGSPPGQETVIQLRGVLDGLEELAPVVPYDINRMVDLRFTEYAFVSGAADLRVEPRAKP